MESRFNPADPLVIYMNVVRIFYELGLAGTITGVVLVHSAHALVYSVWVTTAVFAAVSSLLRATLAHRGAFFDGNVAARSARHHGQRNSTALILVVPSVLFMLVIERFLHSDVL